MYQPNKVLLPFVRRALLAALCGGAIGGCTTEPMKIPESLRTGASAEEAEAVPGNASSPGTGNGGSREAQGPAFGTTPQAGRSAQAGVVDKLDRVRLDDGKANVTVNVEDVTLAAFINEVFGNILGLSFEIDNNLKNKADRVTLRLEQPQTSQMVYNVASQVMANYGVEIVKQGDVLRFQIKQIGLSPDEPPILISGDARPDVPIAYRPVFQFVQLHNVDAKDVIPWLSSAYEKSGLTATADGARGGLMLKGMSSIVTQAAKAVELLDQPFMRGQYSLRIDPAFVSSETLAKQLKTLLVAQGYSVGLGEASGSIVLVPLESSNGLIVFANQQSLLRLVREWAEQADRAPAISAVEDGSGSAKEGLFFYEVRNTRATDLAKSLRSLMSGLGGGGAYGLTPDLSNSASKRAAVDSAVPNRPGSGDMGSTRNAGVSPLLQLAGTQALLGGAGNSGLMDSLASSMMGGAVSAGSLESRQDSLAFGNGHGRIQSAVLVGDGAERGYFVSGERVSLDVSLQLFEPVRCPRITLVLRDARGYNLYAVNNSQLGLTLVVDGSGLIRVRFSFVADLQDGDYALTLRLDDALSEKVQVLLDKRVGVLSFRVESPRKRFDAVVNLHGSAEVLPA